MSTNPLRYLCGLRRSCLAAVALLVVMLWAGTASAQDWAGVERAAARVWGGDTPSMEWARGERESARTSALHNIAMMQAANGDVLGAKETVRQMVDGPVPGRSEVTVVWFCNGQAIYDHPPRSFGSNGGVWQGFLKRERAAEPVPAEVPAGLPANYLAADARRGAVVEFSDEYDSRGTRVTSRTYADGSVVIETPRVAGK